MTEAMDIPLGKLRRRQDARRIIEGAIPGLMESIREVGIIHPLRVRPIDIFEGGRQAQGWQITVGGHRFEAASRLGLDTVPCIVVDDDDLHAELAMIDENLRRANSSPAEEALAVKRRKEIYEALHPEAASFAFKGNQHTGEVTDKLSFTRDAATKTGRDERTIRRDAARGEALGETLKDIAGTSLDKGVELDALAKLPEGERQDIVARAKNGESISARALHGIKAPKLAAEPLNDAEAAEKQVAALMTAWNNAGADARAEFFERIGQGEPVMDRRWG